MKTSRLWAFYGVFAADAILFMVGSFAANLLTGPLNLSWQIYSAIACVSALGYGWVRWVLFKPERIRLLALNKLSDSLAVSATAYGVDAWYNMQRRGDQDLRNVATQSSIDEAESMRLAANSGASYLSIGLNRHWPNVKDRLDQRVPFKVVLLDPFSPDRETRNQINAAGEVDDSKLPLGDIVRAYNTYPDLDIRFAKTGMTCSVFITNTEAYFDPYHLAADGGRITNLFLCLRTRKMIPPQGLSNYDILFRHFDSLWANATPLQSWLEEHAGELRSLPAITRESAIQRLQ